MTRALVVYESMYGNTQRVAQAIADGLSTHLKVGVTEVGTAPLVLPPDVALVVVCGPTHAFSMSRPDSRSSAAQKREPVSLGLGLRDWLEQVEWDPDRVLVATFDTKIGKPRFFWGSAARRAVKRRGVEVLAAKDFYVGFSPIDDALEPGEVERARAWGDQLALDFMVREDALGHPVAVH